MGHARRNRQCRVPHSTGARQRAGKRRAGPMTDGVFIRATLRGKRFKDGELPLSVLADLASLQGMVIDVAKWRFGEANPDRRRSPRGFDQVYLKLTGLGSGGSVAKIEIDTARSVLFGVPNQEYFEMAAQATSPIPSALPNRTTDGSASKYRRNTWHTSTGLDAACRTGRRLRSRPRIEIRYDSLRSRASGRCYCLQPPR